MTEWAVVTGGSSGIGYAYAQQIAKKGYNILLVSNQEEACQTCAKQLQDDYSVDTKILVLDLAREHAAQQIFDFCRQENLVVEVLINNAGMFFWDNLTHVDPQKVLAITQLHITTPTMLCRLFAQDMQERHKGYILNATSICAWMPFPTLANYTSTKSYLRKFSLSLHYEMKDAGVHVTHVAPGAVDTGLYGLKDSARKKLLRWHIMTTPEQVAKRGVSGLLKGRRCVIPGAINLVFIGLVKIVPLGFVNLLKKIFLINNRKQNS